MTEDKYLKERVEDQINWYSKKSAINKKYHLATRTLVMIFAALIPFVAGYLTTENIWLNHYIALLGVLTAVFSGLSVLFKFQEKWSEYRTTSETLKQEKYLFLTKSGPYDNQEETFKIFVKRIEHLISKENTAWSQYINKEE